MTNLKRKYILFKSFIIDGIRNFIYDIAQIDRENCGCWILACYRHFLSYSENCKDHSDLSDLKIHLDDADEPHPNDLDKIIFYECGCWRVPLKYRFALPISYVCQSHFKEMYRKYMGMVKDGESIGWLTSFFTINVTYGLYGKIIFLFKVSISLFLIGAIIQFISKFI